MDFRVCRSCHAQHDQFGVARCLFAECAKRMGRPAQYRVKQNPKLDTAVESQVSKTARPGAPSFENTSKEAAQAESILDNNRVISTECSRRNRPFSWPTVSIGHASLTT